MNSEFTFFFVLLLVLTLFNYFVWVEWYSHTYNVESELIMCEIERDRDVNFWKDATCEWCEFVKEGSS
jgi:hypothetical protein